MTFSKGDQMVPVGTQVVFVYSNGNKHNNPDNE